VVVSLPLQYGNTPLILAADRGNLPIVEELVERHAKVNAADTVPARCCTPCQEKHALTSCPQYGQTSLMYAAFGNHFNVVKYLVRGHACEVTHDSRLTHRRSSTKRASTSRPSSARRR
jgi:ankyrin repeat protein